MRKLIYGDCFPRLLQNMRQYPGRWAARLVFLLGPWLSFWMVEILNGNDVFNDLYAWQVLMNLIWYYLLFFLCRLILGRNQWASTAGALLSFAFGLVNHYVLRFRGRILFPADVGRMAYGGQCGRRFRLLHGSGDGTGPDPADRLSVPGVGLSHPPPAGQAAKAPVRILMGADPGILLCLL